MQWSEPGLVLGARRHGDDSVVLEVMTASRGRHLGLVRAGRSSRLAAVIQPGNTVSLVWRARLDEHLGVFTIEPLASRAGRLIGSVAALHAVQLLTAHLRLLPERDPHPALYAAVEAALDGFASADDVPPIEVAAFIARFEIALLEELGFGLDLAACAVTGTTEDLAFVSPKSGRAVSREGGVGYEERLLTLPRFMLEEEPRANIAPADVADAFRLTGHFLDRHVYAARALNAPDSRAALLDLLARQTAAG